MKDSINVYWCLNELEEGYSPSIPFLISPPSPVIPDYSKIVLKEGHSYKEYLKCPAFQNEFTNTFIYKAFKDITLDIDPKTNKPTDLNNAAFVFDPHVKRISMPAYTAFFSDQSLEMSLIPASLHSNNFIDNSKIFSGKYNIGKWFRPIHIDFIAKNPQINIKKGDAIFYLKFNTDKKINFINFEFNNKISKISDACADLKSVQPGYRFKEIYNMFTRIGYHKKLLKEIKKSITPLK